MYSVSNFPTDVAGEMIYTLKIYYSADNIVYGERNKGYVRSMINMKNMDSKRIFMCHQVCILIKKIY